MTTEIDADLARAVRSTTTLRTGFYIVVLLIALGGQVSGAMEALDMQWYVALPAVGALELGGMVVLANADVRRRLGEHATLSRLLSAAIAGGAVAFNWLAHTNHLEGGFYAGMSLLGYLVWLMNTENKRRDRLRAERQLPPTTPAYEVFGHWLRNPWLTRRARSLAKADPSLGLYDSLDAARTAIRTERRQAAIARVVRRKITERVGKDQAEIAVTVYDLDRVAQGLADAADYAGLTQLIAVDLDPARLAGDAPQDGKATHPKPPTMTRVDATVTRPGDAALTHDGDAPATQPVRALPPAVTRLDSVPTRRAREVVMRRPESVPPVDAAERDAAIQRAVDAHLTRGVPKREAARVEGVSEAAVRRAVTRITGELTHAHNGHNHTSQN